MARITEPIIHDYVTQIFCKHYKMQPEPAAKEALRFLEITDLYGMQLIMGDWVKPEPALPAAPVTGWNKMIQSLRDVEESGREPWLAVELH